MSILGELRTPFVCDSQRDGWLDARGTWVSSIVITNALNAIPALEAERDALALRVKELEAVISAIVAAEELRAISRVGFDQEIYDVAFAALKENPNG